MKKLAFFIAVILLSSIAFASDYTISGKLTGISTLLPNASATAMSPGKSRVFFNGKVNNNVTTYIETDLAANFAVNYVWADTALLGGTLRIGLQKLGIANMGGGMFQSNTFYGVYNLAGLGTSWRGNLAGLGITIMSTSLAIGNGADKNLSVKADISSGGMTTSVAGMVNMPAGGGSTQLAAYADSSIKLDAIKVGLQAYMDLTDNGIVNAAAKQMAAGGYAECAMTPITVFGDYVVALNDATKATGCLGLDSEITLGGKLALNSDTTFIAEGISQTIAGNIQGFIVNIGIELNL